MASCIGTGRDFFGLPTTKGRVLYVEVDAAEVVVVPRLKLLTPADNVWFLFMNPLSIPQMVDEETKLLEEARDKVKPDVVFLNTLRKVHNMDDKDSKTPKVVYTYFRTLFPNSSIVYVHHTRKSPVDPAHVSVGRESYSGSKHWLDDAQVGLLMELHKDKRLNSTSRLTHIKSQVSSTLRPLPLHLHEDGSKITSPLTTEFDMISREMKDWKGEVGEFDKVMADKLGLSPMSIRRRRKILENGKFPGSRIFLEREDDD